MKLKNLLTGIVCKEIDGSVDIEINNIYFDSRKVAAGDLFVAQSGVNADGHNFIEKTVEAGAVAVVCEHFPEHRSAGVTYIVVENSSMALGILASNYYGNPSSEMQLVGVTGTNGKTTTVTLLYDLVRMLGHKAGLLSTVCNYIDGEAVPSTHTTPDAIEINRLMRRMVDAGCIYCFMEVSSHSVVQKRISGLDFAGAVFSNITHDHLDYHKTFKAYIEAKKGFFDGLNKTALALVNADDKNGMVMLQNTVARKYTYSCRMMADYNAKVIEKHLDGTLLQINGDEVWCKFTGDFNAYNLLAVYSTAILLGFDKTEVLRCISLLTPVAGRFETIISPQGVVVVVDYAHTPDALENVLSTIKNLRNKDNSVITVVGAGGDRDKTKRPEMADVACRYSDKVILTSDNPRSEEPEAILKDMQAGVKAEYEKNVLYITNRREAIRIGLMLATKNDIVLIAGKGHENYQEIKGVKYHFDDREVVREELMK
ncbi:UDP-N-acetylmuramoyl-L-alanyl-D-glutamate--2,6-diaminopimelate ligase [Odoribacter sp. OttesenSCG-928-J03]|nr:UDP-N-acetylmuramoyl-L-alanyl-D-glutamate--2,6-diaminopimelate ligase [Odoribacter sp. OttesenSCG-928-J03]MDL2283454.1 UDP-N-acetylmuramoyl-L-alanyl-D-glutamate--2,6-diaminopimelate ligase [Odoribacter sp. OttesenSCG-928-G04]MDL2331263.1 UDP-N-acetylmuramoyl-L-alanyl-D-glutamate--2,6-diaminopimelate ligase [Odoribacter sp. OttesenSCG-928-A06]